ncbi:carbamoyltransferase C-terminal domain-containing protein [Streptomyces griseus]|uniref:carbamoyltransferase C-terminal domain-containing protein n=1 Tax=Streptomyces griseus TaxID=1911 RepID=UPI003F4BC22B
MPEVRPDVDVTREAFMNTCGIKLTRDGAVAVVEDGRLGFSIEAQKLADGERNSALGNMRRVLDVLDLEGMPPAYVDPFVFDGWYTTGVSRSHAITPRNGDLPVELAFAPYPESSDGETPLPWRHFDAGATAAHRGRTGGRPDGPRRARPACPGEPEHSGLGRRSWHEGTAQRDQALSRLPAGGSDLPGNRCTEASMPGTPDPYMLFEHRMRPGCAERVPAAVRLDGTAGLQTIDPGHRSDTARVLAAYEEVSGLPVLCSTSANFETRGLLPDVASAARWGGRRYICSQGVPYTHAVAEWRTK